MSYPIYWKIVHHIFKSLPIYRHIFSHNVSFSYIYINTPNMKSHITYTIHVLPHLLEDLSHNVSNLYIYIYELYTPYMKSHIIYTIHVLPHLLEDLSSYIQIFTHLSTDLSHTVSIIYIYMYDP